MFNTTKCMLWFVHAILDYGILLNARGFTLNRLGSWLAWILVGI